MVLECLRSSQIVHCDPIHAHKEVVVTLCFQCLKLQCLRKRSIRGGRSSIEDSYINRVGQHITPDSHSHLFFGCRSFRNISNLPRRVTKGRRTMDRVTAIALGALIGVIIIVGVLQSWKPFRRTRTERIDLENGKVTGDGRANVALNDMWIFGSVANRSCTSSRLGPDAMTECRGWSRPSPVRMTLVEPEHGSNLEALGPSTEAEAEAESDAKVQAGGWLDEHMSALPSPPHVYLARKFQFQHASLVPVPLRPLRVRASTASERNCNSEFVEIGIHPISERTYLLHPHPLKSHPIHGDLLNQTSEDVTVKVQKQHHSKEDSNNRCTERSVFADVCRPDSTTLGTNFLTRPLETEPPHIQQDLQNKFSASASQSIPRTLAWEEQEQQ